MKTKCRLAVLLLAAVILLTACTTEQSAVSVERVDMLLTASQAIDRYAGMVISENATKVSRDPGKTISELKVAEGDEVTTGQILFSYDSEALSLELERQKLDLERLNNQVTQFQNSLKDLKSQLTKAEKAKDEKLISELKIAIASKDVDVLSANYEVKTKKKEIEHTQEMLRNVHVTSPVDGRIRKIDESGEAYITIQRSGMFRVKGTLNELNMNSGIMEGTQVRILSRLDETQVWTGYVSSIDTENNQDSGSDGYYYGYYDSMSSSSSYAFYIELDDAAGLMLGQHVYIEQDVEVAQLEGVWVPSSYLMDLNCDEETFEMTAAVWAVSAEGKLERRTVTVGMFDDASQTYEILDGLTESDYLANPADPGCAEGADVAYRSDTDFDAAVIGENGSGDPIMPSDIVLPNDVYIPSDAGEMDEMPETEAGGQE